MIWVTFQILTLNNLFISKGARVPEVITIRLTVGFTVEFLIRSKDGNVRKLQSILVTGDGKKSARATSGVWERKGDFVFSPKSRLSLASPRTEILRKRLM